MSDRSTPLRRRFALGAAVLVTAAAFLATSSGPVGAGGPWPIEVTPASAEVGDTVTAANANLYVCSSDSGVEPTVEVTLHDADDAEVLSTPGTIDAEGNWTADIDTTGLAEGDYEVKARCMDGDSYANYQSEDLTLTAPAEPTTTTTEATTSTTETPTTDAPAPEGPTAPPAGAVAGTPSYTG